MRIPRVYRYASKSSQRRNNSLGDRERKEKKKEKKKKKEEEGKKTGFADGATRRKVFFHRRQLGKEAKAEGRRLA